MVGPLDERSFRAICDLAYRTAGLKLGDGKRQLVVSRLQRRLTRLGLATFDAYVDLLSQQDAGGTELREMINCLTTNKTDFFREAHHFEFLRRRVFPEAQARARAGRPRTLRVWSAGCSTGEEPYTIAMVLRELTKRAPGWGIEVIASDIDTSALDRAKQGVYDAERLVPVPQAFRDAYFAPAPDGRYRVDDAVRDAVHFRRINFMDDPWPIKARFDVIFCRNVTIYFDRATQDRFYRRLVRYLEPHGYLVAGHSENLAWLPDVLRAEGDTVYAPVRASTSAARGPDAPPRKFVASGGVEVSATPCVLRTVLGTCVSVCLWDPGAQIGGMNHFMLPDGHDVALPARFGVHAMEVLVNELMHLGADRRRLVAKAVGGARVLASDVGGAVADQNAAFVREFLAAERIPVVAERLGGDRAIEVEFHTHTGRVFTRPVTPTAALVDSEARARLAARALARKENSDAGDVLF